MKCSIFNQEELKYLEKRVYEKKSADQFLGFNQSNTLYVYEIFNYEIT